MLQHIPKQVFVARTLLVWVKHVLHLVWDVQHPGCRAGCQAQLAGFTLCNF